MKKSKIPRVDFVIVFVFLVLFILIFYFIGLYFDPHDTSVLSVRNNISGVLKGVDLLLLGILILILNRNRKILNSWLGGLLFLIFGTFFILISIIHLMNNYL
jgi:hypothetical protein